MRDLCLMTQISLCIFRKLVDLVFIIIEMRNVMGNDLAIYVSALQDALRNKWDVLKKILELTQAQNEVLSMEEVNIERFDELVGDKEKLLKRLEVLDNGFQELFDKIGTSLKENSVQYKSQILEMQNYIRTITECSVKIQTLEQRNKEKFTAFVSGKRKEIREFKKSNKTAVSYYQNMANQHREWQSYFVDKKK